MAIEIPDGWGPSALRLRIGTHNGHFHADEALAVYLIRLLPLFRNALVIRTRDPSILARCDVVVDVGGIYKTDAARFDHHQRGFSATFPGRTTPLSAAGLVYLFYGRAIVGARMRPETQYQDTVEKVWRKMYTDFVEAIDADDNGVSVWEDEKAMTKRFNDGGVRLSALVADMNMDWHDDRVPQGMLGPSPSLSPAAVAENEQAGEDARFETASQLMGTVFLRKLAHLTEKWLPAWDVVVEAFEQRRELDASGRLMVLSESVPWKDHLYEAEAEEANSDDANAAKGTKDGSEVYYVLYPESQQENAKWRVQAVPVASDSFESRRPLRQEWRGLRDAELSEVAGIAGCVFVHAGGFIGGNVSREGAIEMARKSLI